MPRFSAVDVDMNDLEPVDEETINNIFDPATNADNENIIAAEQSQYNNHNAIESPDEGNLDDVDVDIDDLEPIDEETLNNIAASGLAAIDPEIEDYMEVNEDTINLLFGAEAEIGGAGYVTVVNNIINRNERNGLAWNEWNKENIIPATPPPSPSLIRRAAALRRVLRQVGTRIQSQEYENEMFEEEDMESRNADGSAIVGNWEFTRHQSWQDDWFERPSW